MFQGHWPIVGIDDVARSMLQLRNPMSEFARVAYSGTQKNELDLPWEHNNSFLPYNSTLFVSHVVHFVKDYPFHFTDDFATSIYHAAQDFCSHNEAGGFWVNSYVSSYQTYIPELLFELTILLVGEGFDRGGVDYSTVLLQ